jgi:hypothetical protein
VRVGRAVFAGEGDPERRVKMAYNPSPEAIELRNTRRREKRAEQRRKFAEDLQTLLRTSSTARSAVSRKSGAENFGPATRVTENCGPRKYSCGRSRRLFTSLRNSRS